MVCILFNYGNGESSTQAMEVYQVEPSYDSWKMWTPFNPYMGDWTGWLGGFDVLRRSCFRGDKSLDWNNKTNMVHIGFSWVLIKKNIDLAQIAMNPNPEK